VSFDRITIPGSQARLELPVDTITTCALARFYTVEARRFVGYDVKLHGEAVVIHDVDLTRPAPAHVVDGDGNGRTDDKGTKWLPGERFMDTGAGITVTVQSATAGGFIVHIAELRAALDAVYGAARRTAPRPATPTHHSGGHHRQSRASDGAAPGNRCGGIRRAALLARGGCDVHWASDLRPGHHHRGPHIGRGHRLAGDLHLARR
jgi:hypothetical protein